MLCNWKVVAHIIVVRTIQNEGPIQIKHIPFQPIQGKFILWKKIPIHEAEYSIPIYAVECVLQSQFPPQWCDASVTSNIDAGRQKR